MRFLVDAQLPPALARWLEAAGHRAEHVSDVGLANAKDQAIWDFASANDAIIVSKDEDFAQLKFLKSEGPALVWVRLPNSRKRELLDWFEQMLPEILAALERGESLVELV